jgi:hypothetical protein
MTNEEISRIDARIARANSAGSEHWTVVAVDPPRRHKTKPASWGVRNNRTRRVPRYTLRMSREAADALKYRLDLWDALGDGWGSPPFACQ